MQNAISSQMDAYRWVQERLGGCAAYPGHPLVLSTIIMHAFDNLEAAGKPTVHGWSTALADCRVPGAGDHVGQAMRILRMGREGASADEMVDAARRYWINGNAGGHHANVELGNTQASTIEPLFRATVGAWLRPASARH